MNSERILRSLAECWGFGVKRLTTREFESCKYLDRFSIGFGTFYICFQLMSAGALGRLFRRKHLGRVPQALGDLPGGGTELGGLLVARVMPQPE